MDLAIARYGDAEGGGCFDRPSDAAPMGGLDVRRKPFQDSPTPGANSVAAIALVRMHAFTGDDRYHAFAQKTFEAFAGIAPQYGLFAASYGWLPPSSPTIRFKWSSLAQRTIPPPKPSKLPPSRLPLRQIRPPHHSRHFQLHLAGAINETLSHLPPANPSP